MKSPASVAMAPRRSSPRSACQWTSSRPVPTCVLVQNLTPGRPARATPTSKASSAKPPPQPDAPTPSSAHATGASPDASASRKPRSRSLGPFWSSSGTYWPTPPADTTTSGRSSTTTASDPNAANATTSANSSHSATPSHSPKSPELPALATVYFPVRGQLADCRANYMMTDMSPSGTSLSQSGREVRPWLVAVFATEGKGHPADRIVQNLVDSLRDAGAGTVRRSVWLGKAFERIGRFTWTAGARRTTVLPLMGSKWWRLTACTTFGPTIPYCWDVWGPELDVWTRRLSEPGIVAALTSSSIARDELRVRLPNLTIEYVPEAVDMTRFPISSPLRSRGIDVLELGRRNALWHAAVENMLRDTAAVHKYERSAGETIFRTDADLDAGLLDSRISVCFTRRDTHPDVSGSVDALTQRYLQSIAAGCLLLGRAPQDLVGLFGYDPVIPVDWADPQGQVRMILASLEDHQ